MKVRNIAAVAAIAAFAACVSTGASADPWKIRVGWVTTPTHMQPIIDELHNRHPEIFPNFGKTYTVESMHFQGTTPQIEALATNDLDVAAFGPEALALAVDNAHLDVRMIADVFQDGVPGYASITYVVRKDSPVHKVEDLRGKVIATNAIGSFGDSAMRIMLRRHGLQDKDFTTVEANFNTMPAMLDEGKVALINLLPQFRYMMTEQGKYRPLFTAEDGEGRIQAVLWAMRADVLAAHRPAVVDFLTDHVRAVRYLIDPAHHEETVAIVAAVTKAKPETLQYVYTKADSFHAPDGKPDVAATQRALDVELKYGLIKNTVTVSPKYVDLGPIEEADRRLGNGS
ncbi:MAG TPA: PhnD/SsuA/transferrin family substrate-binding protein [Stellaceae bacterium]|jgi:NitT/TauT family transport system substrate-binding protein